MTPSHIWIDVFDRDALTSLVIHFEELPGFFETITAMLSDNEHLDPEWRVEFGPAYTEEEMYEVGLIERPEWVWQITGS